ncbi:D-alanine--D-alanine ligase family protein [Cellulomonas bogoriensis]|uniref:D-alanine--D-alanine ligase n=1 Tax=Cellulomonas bogoriensis 69B4 = DSM 16987 TaxID=1386082 RepID=A0A0A0BZ54_9CELL|nr:D-alanine--D-alanine ligase family protein [Cellulomonas bogoriensis]KGM12987.1 D-alanine--D-alanine ligase [Cellulomonas bogoriensis 69B4 = DSM 16987]
MDANQPPTPAPRRTRVAVVFGGRSGEHSVSCITAAAVLRAIDRDRFDVLALGITRSGRWLAVSDEPARWEHHGGDLPEVTDEASSTEVVLPRSTDDAELLALEPGAVPRSLGPVDVVLPLLHGPYGEDGTVQGLLEVAGVRYAGAGVLASAVGMDKHYMKIVLSGHGIPVGPYVVLGPGQWEQDQEACTRSVDGLGTPVFVKPARAGSSLGITKVDDLADLPAAVRAAQEHDPKVLVEAAIVGREIECAVLGGRDGAAPRTSLPGEIAVGATENGFYDFGSKYLGEGEVRLHCPAELPAAVVDRVRELAARTFQAVGCEGLARVDTFVTGDGQVLVNEINTMPGFTPVSMYPMLWAASGLGFTELVDELIALALERPTGLR